MENYFQMNMDKRQIDAISNLGLAHIGDGVYELMCRSYLCAKGDQTVKTLHRDSVALVKAPTQAKFADKLLPPSPQRLRNMPRQRDWRRCSACCIWRESWIASMNCFIL